MAYFVGLCAIGPCTLALVAVRRHCRCVAVGGGDCVCWLCELVLCCVRVGGVGVHGIVCVCLYICGSMNIGIYMCGVSVCIRVYECPCLCLSVCLSMSMCLQC